jgi:hypothetical protein
MANNKYKSYTLRNFKEIKQLAYLNEQDIKNIAEAILKLAGDKILRTNYSEKIKERTRVFGIKRIIKKYKELI